jgi:hypothetical protein
VRRWASEAAHALCAAALALLGLAICRWTPIDALVPVDVRALPSALAALAAGAAAALAGGPRRGRAGLRHLVAALAAAVLLLAGLTALRPRAGLQARIDGPQGLLGELPPGPVEVVGDDLVSLPHAHRMAASWGGPLRVRRGGVYRFWASGDGRLSVSVDGVPVLEGDLARYSGPSIFLAEGGHRLEVSYRWSGPAAHFRLGWEDPRGRSEGLPRRDLGEPIPPFYWLLTDGLSLAAAALLGILAFRLPWDVPRRPSAPRPVTLREVAGVLLGLVVVVFAMSAPWVLDFAGSGPFDRPDGRLNAWILAWDAHALTTHPGGLFDAPIFHPLPDSLAFSENLLLLGALAAPLALAFGPALAYNAALLGSLLLSGLGAHLLVRRVSGDRLAAFVAGCLFAAGSHRWFRMAHLHAQATAFLPFALWALDRFWERRTLARALHVGLFVLLEALSSVYLGMITATTVGVAIVCAVLGGLGARALLRLALALGLAGVLLAPLVAPYLRMRAFEGREWSLDEIGRSATTLDSYAASATRLYGPLTEREAREERTREPIFPGLVPVFLGVLGLAAAPRRYRLVALFAAGSAVVLSLGPGTPVYPFLYAHVVLFRGLRALNRFSLVLSLVLAVLAGIALSGTRRLRLLALAFGLAEAAYLPLRLAPLAPPSPAARSLAGRRGAVLAFPIGEDDTAAMLQGLAHFRPLVNGDSGFVPAFYVREKELLSGGVDPEALRLLRATGVTEVVSEVSLPLPVESRAGRETVYAVPPGEAAREVPRGTPVPSLWGPHGIVADLGQAAPVSGVVFELGDGPWEAAPEVALSEDGISWTRVPAKASLADAALGLSRDPQGARGEIRFERGRARFVRLDPGVPAADGILGIEP